MLFKYLEIIDQYNNKKKNNLATAPIICVNKSSKSDYNQKSSVVLLYDILMSKNLQIPECVFGSLEVP